MVMTTSAVEKGAPIKMRFGRFEVDEAGSAAARRRRARAPRAQAVRRAVRARAHAACAGDQGRSARPRVGPPVRQRVGAQDDDQRRPRRSRRRPEAAALHRDGLAPRLSLHRRPRRRRAEPAPIRHDPRAASARPRGMAIGRTRELDRLRTRWRAAPAGTRQVAWIAGEAGVGKTALIERFMNEVGEAQLGTRALRRRPPKPRLPHPRGADGPVPPRAAVRAAHARSRAHLVVAAAVALHPERARGIAPRARRSGPGADAARDRRAARSLQRAVSAAAGHRRPAMGGPGDGAAHGLHRAAALACPR